MRITVRMIALPLLLVSLSAAAFPAQSADPAASEQPCGAIKLLWAFERVAGTADAEKARSELADVDAWYGRCKEQLPDDDRKLLEIRMATAKESLSWPRNLQQAVDLIVRGSNPEEMAIVAAKKREDLIEFHMGWGMGIRNGLGLWRGNEALLISACGGEPCHPDDASMKIIEAVWEHLQQHPPAPRK